MKKKIAGLLAAVMVLAMGTTVFAAPSAEAGAETEKAVGSVKTEATAVTPDGKSVTVTVKAVENTSVLADAKKEAEGKGTVLGIVDVTADLKGAKSVDVTFSVAGVKAGENIVVLHQKADGKWETLPIVKVEDGKVTATFTSFSPVVVVKAKAAASNGTEGATSPKDGAPVSALPVLAMLCAAGVVVFGRKVKFN